ncbi:MAG TPA: universal stress protein [Kofleriaceae bacterium]|nr:universal stress protein [Kofleriaceae bacterium]
MRILTALDRSEYAEIVLEHAIDQAARHPGAELHFAIVIDDDRQEAEARAWLDATVREGLETFGMATSPATLHVRRGLPAATVAALATELAADLLVIGRFEVPSASDIITQIADCPMLVVGIDGPVLEPQCPDCAEVRRASDGEQLFCERHHSERMPGLVTRLPPSTVIASRLW